MEFIDGEVGCWMRGRRAIRFIRIGGGPDRGPGQFLIGDIVMRQIIRDLDIYKYGASNKSVARAVDPRH